MPNSLIEVRGIEETRAILHDAQRQVDPRRGLRDTVTLGTGMLHRYATSIVHVGRYPRGSGRVGGRLKNSLFWDVSQRGNSVVGRVGTNVEYAPYEHARGGSHAFFDRTVREEGRNVNSLFAERISLRVR